MINREVFYKIYRQNFGPLSVAQVNNLNFLLAKLDQSETFSLASEYAYILATIMHETNRTFAPVKEAYWIKPEALRIRALRYYYRKKPTIVHPDGKLYAGVGYVQLTHDFNYKKFAPVVEKRMFGVNIFSNPELAGDPEVAWIVLEEGMTSRSVTFRDETFTGFVLADFVNESKTDYVRARKVINGMDRASLIAGYAEKFYDCIEFY